ncbi:MAG: Ig-like domain-containing protein [Bacteroidaceae bacterium]|nr:Ig-like domain-containing protein [Bacteroidaceae bacterium]
MRHFQKVQGLSNRFSEITRTLFNAASAILAFAALSGCAAVGNPDGGPYDENPPRITGSHPDNGATGVKNRKITIDFNEFIKLENASEKVVISPPQLDQPEIKVIGKRIQVELQDSLRPNTTYSIDFADGIVDNNEGNPLGDYCFRFSTGDAIDTLEVSGYVLNAQDLEPVKGITVGLHSDLSDSAFMTKPFERVSRTDAEGHFTIRGIAPGTYRAYAVMDMDQTFSYSQRNEMIAWMDSVIIPSSELRYRQDSIFADDGTLDTIVMVPYTRFFPDDITMLAFTPEPVQQYMTAYERPNHETFTLRFALPLDSMPRIKGLNFDEKEDYIVQHSERYDTLLFWMKDTTVYYSDTLSLAITYLASDTTGSLVPVTDTLNLTPKKKRATIIKEQARKAEEEKKELEKKLRKLERAGDSVGIARLLEPKIKFLSVTLTSGSSMSLYSDVTLDFKEPVTFLSDTAIHMYHKVDTLWEPIPFEIEHDTVNILRYYIYGEWRPDETFRINIDSASILGIHGLHNQPIESTLKFSPLNQFSTLTVNVANPKPGYTVRLHDRSGSVVRTEPLENGSADFYLLPPSEYYVSMFHDENGNGKWDTGEYEEKRHAEGVWYIKRPWNLKQDWTHETEPWNIEDTPLTQQKPDQLFKDKTKKKTVDTHKKNLDRLQNKAKKAESDKKKKERQHAERKQRREKNKEKYRQIRANAKARKEAKAATSEPADTVSVEVPDSQEIETPDE